MNAGIKIAKLREAKNVTQAALAEAVGITRSMLCQIERGTKTVTLPLAVQIVKALGARITDIIDIDEE